MPKPVKSQWDFGELFSKEQIQKTLTVGELTAQIKRLLEKNFGEVQVGGEISNLKVQASGHIYFSLKDASAQLSCVLFRGELHVDRSLIEDGRKVVIRGQVTLYEPRGLYQLRVSGIELQGLGALQAAFEKLKLKLKNEGLFALERKRLLPRFLASIGMVTSPTGAAIRDVLHVMQRRNPVIQIVLAPCRVQGAGAADEVAAAIGLLNDYSARLVQRKLPGQLDCILITRGGGSLEDLWPFNEEIVARAIFNSALPVVSAVGHEVDFTIADFVADLRAATPSAAAEILTEGAFAASRAMDENQERLRRLAVQQLQRRLLAFEQTTERFQRVHPLRAIEARGQQLDDLLSSLSRSARTGLRQQRAAHQTLVERLTRSRPGMVLARRHQTLLGYVQRLMELVRSQLHIRSRALGSSIDALRFLGPEQVLSRGYSITMTESGAIVSDAKTLQKGELITTRLKAGLVSSRVQRVEDH